MTEPRVDTLLTASDIQASKRLDTDASNDGIVQLNIAMDDGVIVDLFAGGGGTSTAIESALGLPVDVAINHSPDAISMHEANHPRARHYCEDVWQVDPVEATGGRPVRLLHASPDCRHFSQARGGQPRSRNIRGLSWVVCRWAGKTRPAVITLENVVEILAWGKLIAKRCPKTGRVIRIDGTVAAPGERVPVAEQYLVPDPRYKGRTWQRFVGALRGMGYAVQWKSLTACDYGAPTSRTRLYMVARRDGRPIVWPAPTHAKHPARGQKPWRSAAECIDWSIPCPSIFTRKKPLADATMRRIAKGMQRSVIDSTDPFIVPQRGEPSVAPYLTEHANASNQRVMSADEPLRTQCATVKGGHFSVVAPSLIPLTHVGGDRTYDITDPARTITAAHRGEIGMVAHVLVHAGHGEGKPGRAKRRGAGTHHIEEPLGSILAGGNTLALVSAHLAKFRGDHIGTSAHDPLPTITSGAGAKRPAGAAHALGVVTAFMEQANTGMVGHEAREPLSTIVGSGSTQRVVAANLLALRKHMDGRDAADPLSTITADAKHHAVVQYSLSPAAEEGALRVAAFLMRYHGQGGQHGDPRAPASTITTKDRLALVTVTIRGTPYVIVDIGLRMLQPRELYLAQGFPSWYAIARGHDGRVFSKSAQVKMVGNSVSPPPMVALLRANFDVGEQAVDTPVEAVA